MIWNDLLSWFLGMLQTMIGLLIVTFLGGIITYELVFKRAMRNPEVKNIIRLIRALIRNSDKLIKLLEDRNGEKDDE
jgi:hypothetical protein